MSDHMTKEERAWLKLAQRKGHLTTGTVIELSAALAPEKEK